MECQRLIVERQVPHSFNKGQNFFIAIRLPVPDNGRIANRRMPQHYSLDLPRIDIESGTDNHFLCLPTTNKAPSGVCMPMSPLAYQPPGRMTSAVACASRK